MAIFDSDERRADPPEPGALDYAQSVAKLGLAAVAVYQPKLAPLLVAWDQFSGILFNRRMATFFESVFGELKERVKEPEALFRDDQFVSALVQTMQTAAKTHQAEKLDALKNAVLNVALGNEPASDRQQQFFTLADRFSETHLGLLRFFQDPAGYFQARGKPVPMVQVFPKLLVFQLLTEAMPDLRERVKSPTEGNTAASFQFVDLVLRDLISAKLVSLEPLSETWAVPKFDQNRTPTQVKRMTTHLGDDFLAFITEPPQAKVG